MEAFSSRVDFSHPANIVHPEALDSGDYVESVCHLLQFFDCAELVMSFFFIPDYAWRRKQISLRQDTWKAYIINRSPCERFAVSRP